MSTPEDLAALKAAIEERHGSVHQFCRRRRESLNRSTVYMVLAGVYPGNVERQVRRIQAALAGGGLEGAVMAAVKEAACATCAARRPGCNRCDDLYRAQAQAAMAALEDLQ